MGPEPAVALVLPPREGFGPESAGAIGLNCRRLARAARGFRVRVIGPPQSAPVFADAAFQVAPAAFALGPAWRRYVKGVARLLRADPPALIEVHNRPDIALDLARRLPGARVALFLGNDPAAMRGFATPSARALLLARLVAVVSASRWLRARLLEGIAAPPPGRALVLPNCLDLAALPLPLAPGQRVAEILFAGRVAADKGAEEFVAACASALPELPGWRARMVGADRFGAASPETPFLRALRPRAAAAGVELAGYLPHAGVLAAMARAAIVAVPSRWEEPFGLAALEALAGGAALVSTARGGLPEVTGAAAEIVPAADPVALAAAFTGLGRDPARRAALGVAGRLRATLFDAPAVAARLDRLRQTWLGTQAP